jgi:serine phosphatase RsbU (regulator of sigma subunit)
MALNSWSAGMNNVVMFFQKSLEILRVFKDELRDGRKLRSEMEIAGDIQKQSLSQEEDILPGLTVAIGAVPAEEIGGDTIDIIE